MRKLKCVLMFGLVLLLIAGCSKENIQPDPLNATDDVSLKKADAHQEKGKKDHYVPFKGYFEVSVDEIIQMPVPGEKPKIQIVKGSGNATHMGRSEVSIWQLWGPHPDPPLGCIRAGKGWGNFTFTAANGDRLIAEYVGTSVHWSATDVDIVFKCTIVGGGTGRFKDAEGYFDWIGKYNPEIDLGEATITGKIKY